MNVPQSVFLVVYAIFWGTMANTLPRWKMFDTGSFCKDGTVRRRLLLSLMVANILPIVYFALVLTYLLKDPRWEIGGGCWGLPAFLTLGLSSACGAFAPFGFYRLWLWAVQTKPRWFYPLDITDTDWSWQYPLLPKKDLENQFATGNLVFCILYVAVSIICALTLRQW